MKEITLPYTIVVLTLKDSYSGVYLSDSEFSLYADKSNKTRKLTTGAIIAQGLAKDTTYHLRQLSTAGGYRITDGEYD